MTDLEARLKLWEQRRKEGLHELFFYASIGLGIITLMVFGFAYVTSTPFSLSMIGFIFLVTALLMVPLIAVTNLSSNPKPTQEKIETDHALRKAFNGEK